MSSDSLLDPYCSFHTWKMKVEDKTSLNKIWLLDAVSVFGGNLLRWVQKKELVSVTEPRMDKVQNCDSYIDFVLL
jgi:hypothetical protein